MQTNAEGLRIINLYDDEFWAEESVEHAEKAVNLFVKAPLTSNQFSAVVSFVVGQGIEAFRKSQLLRLLNRSVKDRDALIQASQEFQFYVAAKDKDDEAVYKQRRELERSLFLKPEIVAKKRGRK